MTEDEWDVLSNRIDNVFAGEWDDDRIEAFWPFLRHYSVDEVYVAVVAMARDGQRFAPTLADFLSYLEPPNGAPPFHEAWGIVSRALRRSLAHPTTVHELLEGEHPTVVGWVRAYGAQRLLLEPSNDPDHGGAVMYRLAQSYREHAEHSRARERPRLAGGLPELEERTDGH